MMDVFSILVIVTLLRKKFCDQVNCPSSANGNGFCDPACNNEICGYDSGDCFCSPQCSNSKLYNGQCDKGCDTAACYYDFDECFCSPGCTRYLQNNNVCDDVCNNPECFYDNGNCLIVPTNFNLAVKDKSLWTMTVYPFLANDSNCPDVIAQPDPTFYGQNYDENSATYQAAPAYPFVTITEYFGDSPKLFTECYSTSTLGFLQIVKSNTSDNQATIKYQCGDPYCTKNCMSFDIQRDKCTSQAQMYFKLSWINSSLPLFGFWNFGSLMILIIFYLL